jgi:hypothetical protein
MAPETITAAAAGIYFSALRSANELTTGRSLRTRTIW